MREAEMVHIQEDLGFWDRARRFAAGGKRDPTPIDYFTALGAIVAGVCSAGLVAIGLFMITDTAVPMRIVGGEYAENSEVPAGGDLVVVRNYCVDRPIRGTVERHIVDGVVWALPATESAPETGCFIGRKFLVDLPDAIPPGEYRYLVSVTYKINPLVTRTVSHPPVHFRIARK